MRIHKISPNKYLFYWKQSSYIFVTSLISFFLLQQNKCLINMISRFYNGVFKVCSCKKTLRGSHPLLCIPVWNYTNTYIGFLCVQIFIIWVQLQPIYVHDGNLNHWQSFTLWISGLKRINQYLAYLIVLFKFTFSAITLLARNNYIETMYFVIFDTWCMNYITKL
jgi:hypothetical protein